jgi:hypothetical protein
MDHKAEKKVGEENESSQNKATDDRYHNAP